MDRYHAGRYKAPVFTENLVYRPYERVVRRLDGPRRIHPTYSGHAYVYKWRHGTAVTKQAKSTTACN